MTAHKGAASEPLDSFRRHDDVFVMLPLDIDVPALNLCLMAVARWAVLAGFPDAVLARGQVA